MLNPSNDPTKASHQPQPQQPQPQSQPQQPKRRRYRIPRSCDRCRTSKIKCVFQNGQCAACVTARVPCTFANPGSLKERPPTQKDVEHLQARIRSLERLIHAIDPNLDLSNIPEPIESLDRHLHHHHHHHPALDSTTDPPRIPTSSLTLPDLPFSIPAPIHPEDHPPSFAGLEQFLNPTLNSIFNPTRFDITDSNIKLPCPSDKLEDLSPVDLIIRQESQQSRYRTQHFYPEPDLEQDLLKIYFRDFHPFLAILHPPSFIQEHQGGLTNTDDSFRALCLMICALASRFSKDPRVRCDIAGNCDSSNTQTAGLRYCMTAVPYIFRLVAAPASLYDLQAIVLLVIYLLGAASPSVTWFVVGAGLQRAQEVGIHCEDHSYWSHNPIHNHLRRKCFFVLYEFDYNLSAALGKPSFMQESDFDVLPMDPEYEATIGTFTNPFLPKDMSESYNVQSNAIYTAYFSMKSSLGGLKNLLPVINAMNAHRELYPGTKFSDCIKSLVRQLDLSMTKSFEQVSLKLCSQIPHNDPQAISWSDLISLSAVTTWYHEFRLLIYRVLFNHKEKRSSGSIDGKDLLIEGGSLKSPTATTTMTKVETPYLEICVTSAREVIKSLNQLKERNLLEFGFFWIPLRLTNAIVVLICSLNKQAKVLSPDQRLQRCSEISSGIEILNKLAPSTYLASRCSVRMAEFFEYALHFERQNQKSSNHHHQSSSSPDFSSSSSSPPLPSRSTSTFDRSKDHPPSSSTSCPAPSLTPSSSITTSATTTHINPKSQTNTTTEDGVRAQNKFDERSSSIFNSSTNSSGASSTYQPNLATNTTIITKSNDVRHQTYQSTMDPFRDPLFVSTNTFDFDNHPTFNPSTFFPSSSTS